MKIILPHLIILTLAIGASLSGLMSSLVFHLTDLTFRLTARPASGNIVIVAIDRKSLDQLGPWPWPRRHHAAALDRLKAAGAGRIAFDIDFSGRTNAADDQDFANAIGRASGDVILPVFRQSPPTRKNARHLVQKWPYAPFTLGANLASAMVRLESDGNVRRYISGDDGKGGRIPGLATLLAGKQPPSDGSYFLDFGIRPDSVPRISYVDVLTGNFREASLKDKTIIIGAMADELGDQIAVPVHGVLPGPLVHALAFESLFQGRDIYGRTVLFILMTAFLLIMSTGRLLERRPHLPG